MGFHKDKAAHELTLGIFWVGMTLRDELLNGEIFYTLAEAQILIEAWCRHSNTVTPHSSPG